MTRVRRNAKGAIENALQLRADDCTGKKVACPLCKTFPPFQNWPLGWDAHAAHKYKALRARGVEERKRAYKKCTAHLFR